MKLIGIGLLLLASLEAFAVMLDVFQGMTLQRAIVNSLTFAILEVGEWIIILLFLFIIFLEASESFRKKRKRT
ncbi:MULTISPECIES: hypothetical protein [Bacillus]|uniref:Uncharacterized protein n=2 Tax=Bacillus licheniformis TaxID=1402 RepID=Q65NF6_BACLD|nr:MULTISPECIES: hypothetical protein [Bacillus]MDP4081787.1 hypothetical protein [Bacillota bacterium]AAU22051.1 hypothetical protein BL01847 [Bacillus licheniformis DSM 13 = ATCC 14580]AAU39408.1 putative transmembrane protein YczF [Bacillus licheniformis DSM 13 = ATCC 14580]AKQ71561.1 transmembrane protein YczF [Bacillus licheniformis WX-02]AMR09065.1 hypothetical protein AB684_02265 [Bacillus licheniformis]